MPNSCPHSKKECNAPEDSEKKKDKKEYMKKVLKNPKHNIGHGNRTPRPVHARRREGKKCKAATVATGIISHKR